MSNSYLPYAIQSIDQDDIEAVVRVMQSEWLTTGPAVDQFEEAIATYCGARFAVAVTNGTAALHAAVHAAGIGPGDEVIVPTISFVATANAVVYSGATPVFADVDLHSLLLDPEQTAAKISSRTKAIIAVDFAGQACEYDRLRALCNQRGLILISDACHSLGGAYKGMKCGSLADMTVFSFHPVKPITTAEGGMVLTDNPGFAKKIQLFRNHGISTDFRLRQQQKQWQYEMVELGYNLRLSDLHAALGLSQLRKIDDWTAARNHLANRYDEALGQMEQVKPLTHRPECTHSYHLYVVRVPHRSRIFTLMRDKNIGVNVHYLPIHLQPYYQQRFGTKPGDCPVAETAYQHILSLPLFVAMVPGDVDRVVNSLKSAIHELAIEDRS